MTTKEKVEVMNAYLDGKRIQFAYIGSDEWSDYVLKKAEPSWSFDVYDYRVKPECDKREMRPFKDVVEFTRYWQKARGRALEKDGCFNVGGIWLSLKDNDRVQHMITSIDWFGNLVFVDGYWCSMRDLAIEFCFSDGSPCGVIND